jgi:hypothetical protein
MKVQYLNYYCEIRKNEMSAAYGMYGGEKRCIQGFGGETCGKEPLARPGCRWEDNIKMDLQEIGWWHGLY